MAACIVPMARVGRIGDAMPSRAATVGGRAGLKPPSPAFAHPHRDVGGLQRLVHDTGQVISDCVQVHGVLEAGRERRDGLIGVISCPVEPSIHHPLHPPP